MARAHRVWVVDDDPDLRQMLATYLGDQGYEVRTLEGGTQLTARLQGRLGGERPDVLVLDLMLPGDDGLTLLRRLRDGGDDLPVVMLTARADAVDRIIGLEQGADDYLEGEAETIDYDGKGDRVKFIGRAEMRRYRGTTLADETQGSLITYENTTDVFTVNGAPLGQRAPGAVPGAGGRVRAVLAPRVSSPGATSAPAGAASAPAPLRASPGLAGERK